MRQGLMFQVSCAATWQKEAGDAFPLHLFSASSTFAKLSQRASYSCLQRPYNKLFFPFNSRRHKPSVYFCSGIQNISPKYHHFQGPSDPTMSHPGCQVPQASRLSFNRVLVGHSAAGNMSPTMRDLLSTFACPSQDCLVTKESSVPA